VTVEDLLRIAATADPDRLRIYPDDLYFREMAHRLSSVDATTIGRVLRRTAFLVFKPESVAGRRIEPALRFLADHGFAPLGARRIRLEPWTVRELWRYQLNSASLALVRALDLTVRAGPSVFVALYDTAPGADDAATRLGLLKGSSDSDQPTEGLLRAALGRTITCLSFVHTADEAADMVRELGVLFAWPAHGDLLELMQRQVSAGGRAEVDEVTREVYAAVPAHPLDLDAGVSALLAAADALPPDQAAMARDIARAVRARPRETRLLEMIDWLDATEHPIDRWDRVTIAAHLAEDWASGRPPLIAARSSTDTAR
jgi:hypothetical protein